MAKLVIGIIAIGILIFIVFAMMCAMIVAGCSDEDNKGQTGEGTDNMFFKKQLCPKCMVGQQSYELDRQSEMCPYILCWKDGKCSYYVPLEKPSKAGLFKRNKNKDR